MPRSRSTPCKHKSRRSSSYSSMAGSSNRAKLNPISAAKVTRKAHQSRKKKNAEIKELFSRFKKEVRSRNNSQTDISIIEIDDTSTYTPNISKIPMPPDQCLLNSIVIDDNGPSTPKRINLMKLGEMSTVSDKNLSKCIVISDEPGTSTPNKKQSQMHHSTPKPKPSIDELLLKVNKEINNNKRGHNLATIDLTVNTGANANVIDLDATIDEDCVLTSISQGSSMSGDSNVTVLHNPQMSKSITSQFKDNLVNLRPSDRDKIVAFISDIVLSQPTKIGVPLVPRTIETEQDAYIKDVIVGRKVSQNSIGSNIYNPEGYVNNTGLRMIFIDGSNVAMAHGSNKYFSVPGLQIMIDYFLRRGHAVKAFVPRFRCKSRKSSHPYLLTQMERRGHVVFTPSREIRGKNIVSYDDRYFLQCAAEFDGVVVSNDNFNDLFHENPRYADVINNRVLQFTWVNGMLMFPRDPLGKNGPTLETFLKMSPKNNRR